MNDAATRDLPDRLDAAILEHLEAVDRGEPLDHQEFITRHHDVAAELETFFEAARVVQSMAGPTLAESAVALSKEDAQGVDTSRLADTWNPASAAQPLPERLPLPGRFGRYEILRPVGQGAMGVVYLARDTQLSRQVALKIPVFDEESAPEMIDRFYREARATANVRSPNLCPIYDVDQIDGVHFIAMAYIEGRSLSQWAKETPRSPREIAAVVYKVALAMQKAHDQHVIHRDLKPSNIIIDGEGEPVVMDFGLARIAGDIRDTKAGAIIGSPAYMAPEQIAGKEVGPAADVYALGVALFELLAGRLPYEGSVISVIGQSLGGETPALNQICPQVDPRLGEICRRMMQRDLAQRYASMKEVVAALGDYLGDAAPFDEAPVDAEVLPEPLAPSLVTEQEPDASFPAAQARGALGVFSFLTVMVVAGVVFVGGLTWAACAFLPPLFPGLQSSPAAENRQVPPSQPGAGEEASGVAAKEANKEAADGADRAAPLRLRYRWEPGETYGYDLTIETRRGSARETLSGTLFYRVVKVDKKQAVLRFDSRLSCRESSSLPGPPRRFFQGPYPALSEVVGMFPQHELTVDDSGRVLQTDCPAELPFALGPLSQLLIEPLAEDRANRWTSRRSTAVPVVAARRFPGPPPGFGGSSPETDSVAVRVSLSYDVKSLEDSQAKIAKRFSASAVDSSASGASRAKVSGSGEFVLDRRRGRVTWSNMTLSAGDSTVSVRCRLLHDAELAERKKAAGADKPGLTAAESRRLEALTHPPDPAPGRAVTAETPLAPGDQLQVHRMGRWYDARVLGVLKDGRCRVQLIGYGAESAEVVPRSRLRILPAAAQDR
jgi:predicted Ser/Thr protein kinase